MEDSADIFDSSLFTLFAVPPIGFSASNPADPWVYTPPAPAPSASRSPSAPSAPSSTTAPAGIKLWLPQPPANIYAALQANNLWLSAIYLSDRIARGELLSASEGESSAPVLELGAGAGLPSIMACRAGRDVVCTDYDDGEVVRTIRRNFVANVGGTEVGTGDDKPVETADKLVPSSGRWAVRGHTWGKAPAPLLALGSALAPDFTGFDLILADTLWTTAGHGALLSSVRALLRAGGTAHVAAGLHTGRGPVNRFMAAAAAEGLRVEKHGEVRWLPGGGWGPYEAEGEGEGEGEVRGVVVYYTLHKE